MKIKFKNYKLPENVKSELSDLETVKNRLVFVRQEVWREYTKLKQKRRINPKKLINIIERLETLERSLRKIDNYREILGDIKETQEEEKKKEFELQKDKENDSR